MPIVAGALILTACAPNRIYRSVPIDSTGSVCVATNSGECSQDPWYQLASGQSTDARNPKNSVHLGFVEFDDQGALFAPELKDGVMNRLRDLSEKHSLLIVVFAHGWKHNASAGDTNVEDFANILQRIAWYDEQVCEHASCANRRVVGLYLGWRGLSATIEPFKELSFWTRKNRAQRVGSDGVVEVLSEVAKIKANGADKVNNRLIVAGHSFGAAVIFTALQQQLVHDTVFVHSGGGVNRNAANLIVLVNPAFEALRFSALERRGESMIHPKTQRPVLAVFTSREDTATRKAFPAGRTLGTLFQGHVSKREAEQNRTALGHYKPFITHELNLANSSQRGAEEPLSLKTFDDVACAWQNFQAGTSESWPLGDLELSRRDRMQTGSQRQNPFYNVSVDPGIIASHSDIWGQRFSEFLYRFVAVQSLRSGRPCNDSADTNLPTSEE
jgi:pimeloyl-ACP methyl ester carboxylesterase